MTPADWIGSLGVTLLLVAFVLNQRGALAADSRAYNGLNAAGAGLAAAASVWIGFWPFVVLEATWMAVALVALLRPRTAA